MKKLSILLVVTEFRDFFDPIVRKKQTNNGSKMFNIVLKMKPSNPNTTHFVNFLQ